MSFPVGESGVCVCMYSRIAFFGVCGFLCGGGEEGKKVDGVQKAVNI